MRALEKKHVSCKWVFTIKHTLERKVDRYKARLNPKEYTKTFGFFYNETYVIDYDESFAADVKMNSIGTLISCAILT